MKPLFKETLERLNFSLPVGTLAGPVLTGSYSLNRK
jgi:hypothetical protein